MAAQEAIYSGKAKKLYRLEQNLIMEFTDNITAFNGKKHDVLSGKARVNNDINSWIMEQLGHKGISTHYIRKIDAIRAEVKELKIIPLECIVRNYAAGAICNKLGLVYGNKLDKPIYQLCYKNDALGDPEVSEYEVSSLGWASEEQLEYLHNASMKINNILIDIFDKADFILADFKLEFGVSSNGEILLGDEISPDSCRIWDKNTREIFDKDRYRKDLGEVISYYEKIALRLFSSLND